jgi:hypothetical protein
MSDALEKLVYRWLKLLRIPTSKQYLQKKLLSHPDYPSLLSLTDTLDEMGVYNEAIVVDKEKFFQLPVPFITQTTNNQQDLLMVSNANDFLKVNPNFLEDWNGVVLLAEKVNDDCNKVNKGLLAGEKQR